MLERPYIIYHPDRSQKIYRIAKPPHRGLPGQARTPGTMPSPAGHPLTPNSKHVHGQNPFSPAAASPAPSGPEPAA